MPEDDHYTEFYEPLRICTVADVR